MTTAKKIFGGIVLVIAGLVAGVCVLAAMQPADYRYERSIVINAPAAQIFPHVNNLKAWESWTPWKDLDPAMVMTFEGPESGIGSKVSWKGNRNAGEGSMTVNHSIEPDIVGYQLDFVKPMPGTAMAGLSFVPQGSNATNVTWAMYGRNDFAGKLIGVFIDCEKMIGEQFDKGLSRLKAVVEGNA